MTATVTPGPARAAPEAGTRRSRLEATRLRLKMPAEGVTAALTFLTFLPLLFLLQLGGRGAVFGFSIGTILAAMNWRELPRLVGRRSFLLIVPALVLLSAFWSEDPGASLRYGAQVLVTVVLGLVLSVSPRRREILIGIFLAFAAYVAVSMSFGRFVGLGIGNQLAFSGLGFGKNFLGEIASTGLLTSAAVLAISLRDRRPLWGLTAVAAIALELYVTLLTRSAGAIIALVAGLGVFTALMLIARLPRGSRAAVTGALGLFVGLAALFSRAVVDFLEKTALAVFDKDPTLTGRTYLWYRAHQLIDEKPFFGHGWAAFWRQGNIDAEGLWRYAGITGRSGFNFHNTLIELLMQLGWVGTAIVLAVVLAGIALLAMRYLAQPRVVNCFWLAFVAFELVRTPYESVGPAPFYFSTALFFAALGSAFRTTGDPIPVRRSVRISFRPGPRPQGAALVSGPGATA